jgi:hypothetical protein
LTIEQLRGMEGARVRDTYAHASITFGVPWNGRSYNRRSWGSSDPVNNALSAANALLNGLCHAAIVSGGYSPALGFIHTGLQTSFVYDIADLYKVELTIPTAFRIVAESAERVETRVREACRQVFKEAKLLQRILPDIETVLAVPLEVRQAGEGADEDPGRPEPLWTPLAEDDLASAEAVAHSATTLLTQPHPHLRESPSPAPPDETAEPAADVADEARLLRRRRAEEGLQSGWTVSLVAADEWRVITRPGVPGYTIRHRGGRLTCDCPDFAKNSLQACKHTFAVALTEKQGHNL